MKIKGKVWLILIASILFLSSMGWGNHVQADSFSIDAESAILIEAKTGKILFNKNTDESLPPASMSKMMTEYLVLEAINNEQLSWDSVITTSNYAHYLGALDGTSRVWLAAGEERTVEELYTAMAVYSANDATVALAEEVAGSEEQFVQLMNAKAEELGMVNTHFVNSTGLPNSMLGNYIPAGNPEDENLMSAKDTAILARELVNQYPEVLQFSSIPEKEVGYFDVHLINFNWMLEGNPDGQARPHTYPGVDGLKTGYTNKAGYCFTGTVEKDGMRLISVVMRSDTMDSRFVETKKLLDYGFNNYMITEIAGAGDAVEGLEQLPVAKGKEMQVPVVLGESITTVIHKDEQDLYTLEMKQNSTYLNEDGKIVAPIEEGQVVGEVELVYSGEEENQYIHLGEGHIDMTELVAQEEVQKAGWLRLFFRSTGDMISGLWERIINTVKG